MRVAAVAVAAIAAAVAVIALSVGALTGFSVFGAGPTPEQQYVQEVRSSVLGLEDVEDRLIVSLGVSTCGASQRGGSNEELYEAGVENGFTMRESKVMIDSALRLLCSD